VRNGASVGCPNRHGPIGGWPNRQGHSAMRQMEIPPFRDEITISDLENLYKHRLSQSVALWPNQAIPLLGYMCWPNNPAERDELMLALRNWANGSQLVPPRLGRIQHEWLRIADILHEHYDLHHGQHQQRRGGPSLGKAITLVAATARSRVTRPANLWKLWEKYKDVAHLVTAAALVCADVRTRLGNGQIGPFGLARSGSIRAFSDDDVITRLGCRRWFGVRTAWLEPCPLQPLRAYIGPGNALAHTAGH
jgi:hypothetical protein